MVKSLFAVLCLVRHFTAAGAIDVKDLVPCKPAWSRYCDHGDGSVSMTNILRCGATLAAISHRVGEPCREACGATVSSDCDCGIQAPATGGGFCC